MAKINLAKEYYIIVDGEKVLVSEEMYRAYYRPIWRESKQKEVRNNMEYSLDALRDDGYEVAADEKLIDEIVADKLLLDELYSALGELTDDERSLINRFFYLEQSERKIADETGIPRNTLVYRKNKILNKLKKIIEKR